MSDDRRRPKRQPPEYFDLLRHERCIGWLRERDEKLLGHIEWLEAQAVDKRSCD
jgi:hypothetical protein